MILATEDALSEAVSQKLLFEVRPDLPISVSIGGRGKSYLESKARDLKRTAAAIPVFMLIDQDRPHPCPPDLLAEWLPGPTEPRMLLRVAAMEVESWLLADRNAAAAFLGVRTNRIPMDTDAIPDPKEFLVNLARRSRLRGIRDDLVPAPGSTVHIGPRYNPRLAEFAINRWTSAAASPCSRSLRRAVQRLRAF
jgi:hypothetical protein